MPTIAVLLFSSLVTVIAVIGLADALAHLLCGVARALRRTDAIGSAHPAASNRTAGLTS